MWSALSARDWDTLKTFLSDDCLYVDMPMPAASARGPEDIVTRLKIGLESLSSYVNHEGLLLSNGVDVILRALRNVGLAQRAKPSGWRSYRCIVSRTARSPCGRTTRTSTRCCRQAPQSFTEGLASADTSWVFDASDLV